MPDTAAPNQTDFASQLPADAYYQLIRTLQQALPPPLSDSPDDLARRDHAAIARVAALHPANAAEADLAALFVAASEQCKDCLRLVQQPEITASWAMKCRAQANSMMRQAQSALRLLLRMQAARQKTEANSAANERAAWTEHCAIALMAQALSPRPEPAAMTGPPTPEPLAEPEKVAQPEPDPVAAEAGASADPRKAALRRRFPWLPDTIVGGPPDDAPVPARMASPPPDGTRLDHPRAVSRTAKRDSDETRAYRQFQQTPDPEVFGLDDNPGGASLGAARPAG